MPRRLTRKQKGFVKDFIRLENGTQAALLNYDVADAKGASVIAAENLNKPLVQSAIQAALPDELLAEVHLEGLSATTGPLDAPDYGVRHRYLDSAYKIKGSYAAEKHVNVNIDLPPSDRLRKIADSLNGN